MKYEEEELIEELIEELVKIVRQIKNIQSIRMLYGFARALALKERERI